MNNSWIEPPPPQRGMGCFGKGCLILFCFLLLLAAAFVGGSFLAVRYLRSSYFVSNSVQLPSVNATPEEQQMAQTKWNEFERAARAHTPARIELTASEINALIASEPDLRGKAYVAIDADTARLQASVPLEFISWLHGRYMNAECSVQSDVQGDVANLRIFNVIVNGKPVGEDVLDYRGPWSFRYYVSQWTNRSGLKTFQIKDGRVILESQKKEDSD